MRVFDGLITVIQYFSVGTGILFMVAGLIGSIKYGGKMLAIVGIFFGAIFFVIGTHAHVIAGSLTTGFLGTIAIAVLFIMILIQVFI